MTTLDNSTRYILYVPLELSPANVLPARSWAVAPGLWLKRLSESEKERLASAEAAVSPLSGLRPNYTVKVDSIAYGDHIRAQLLHEGKHIPANANDPVYVWPEIINIAKMILVTWLLHGNLKFALANGHGFKILRSGKYNPHSQCLVPHECERSSAILGTFLPPRSVQPASKKTLQGTIARIEQYYRPIHWRIDRVSTALSYLWAALVAREPHQVCTNLAILLECLLSTRNIEITHLISERAATILGKNKEDKLQIYKDVKSIYHQRSRIVHGQGVPKKGTTLNHDCFIVSTKISSVPKNMRKKQMSIALELINALLRDEEYMSIVCSQKAEDTITKNLDNLFIERLWK